MASLKAIRNRIRSVKNTQKITKAMKLVAAAKLRRAQDAVIASRPYALRMRQIIATLANVVDTDDSAYFGEREEKGTMLLIPITSDRGLCGGFNTTIVRKANVTAAAHQEEWETVGVSPYGKKGRKAFARLDHPVVVDMADVLPTADVPGVRQAVAALCELYLSGEVDHIALVYNEFQSALTQVPRVETFLPLSADAFSDIESAGGDDATDITDMLFEPPHAELLEKLLPRYLESQLYRAILESNASEQGARMTAMDNASENAGELIDKLSLQMNRARQAAITTELMEITSGAEALKG